VLSRCVRIPRYVCDDAPTPWKGDVIGPPVRLGGRQGWRHRTSWIRCRDCGWAFPQPRQKSRSSRLVGETEAMGDVI